MNKKLGRLKVLLLVLASVSIISLMFFIKDVKEVSQVSIISCKVLGIERSYLFGQRVILDVEGVERRFVFRYVDNLNFSKEVYCDVTKLDWRFGKSFYVLGDFRDSLN